VWRGTRPKFEPDDVPHEHITRRHAKLAADSALCPVVAANQLMYGDDCDDC
jgi:hypothetical protein